ncbi:uncharacterized protein [Henckelia pumila]|uniref:uncharacterized protein n=1 Tax=Henckelia pumila TaxID=405737 RepID=UPI003C6E9F2C
MIKSILIRTLSKETFKTWMLIYKRRLKNSIEEFEDSEARFAIIVVSCPRAAVRVEDIIDNTVETVLLKIFTMSSNLGYRSCIYCLYSDLFRMQVSFGYSVYKCNSSTYFGWDKLRALKTEDEHDAWKKLQTHCEGSASVKKTRMRLITSKFEKMRMEESETIMEYNGRLKSLENEAFILGDPISNERLVSKVLRSVPKRFHTKVCAIDESKDISIMGLDELISSLRTYEMEMEAEYDTKGKFIAFQEVKDSDLAENSIALISKKFTDYLKVMKKKKKDVKSAQRSKFPRLPTSEKPQKPAATRGPRQRYEGMNVSLSDDDSEEEQEKINPLDVGSGVATPGRNTVQKSVCFVASNLDNSSDHEEQVADAYTLEDAVARLEVLMSKKDLELGLLNSELEREKTTPNKFNSSSSKLDSLSTMGNNDNFGLSFKESVFETDESFKTPMFVKEGSDSLNHPSTSSKGNWYFDSGISRHMTGLKDHLTDYIEQNEGTRSVDNCYQLGEELTCRHSKVDEFSLWHQKLEHVNFKIVKNLCKFEAVRGLPNLKSGVPYVCGACQKGKQTRVSHPILQHCGTIRCLELLHMVLMGPMEVESYRGKKYSLVCVDDFSRFTWVRFLREKSDTFDVFNKLFNKSTNLHALTVARIRTDHWKEFENSSFSSLCDKKGISQEFSAQKTPQQNGIVERKNMMLQEMARVMMSSKNISKRFWAKALNTTCYISNRVYLRSGSSMTSYEILMGKRPNLNYFHIFGCVCYVLNGKNHLAKFDFKSDKYLKKKTAEDNIEGLLEILHEEHSVVPDVSTPNTTLVPPKTVHEENSQNNEETEVSTEKYVPSKIQKNHPSSQIIGDVHGTRQTRAKDKVDYRKMVDFDPQDIRSEMGHKEPDVAAGVTTPKNPSSDPSLPLVSVPMEPVPLAVLMPGDPGNAIDLENPSDFSV